MAEGSPIRLHPITASPFELLKEDFLRWFHTPQPGKNPVTLFLNCEFFADRNNIVNWLAELRKYQGRWMDHYTIMLGNRRIGLVGNDHIKKTPKMGVIIGEVDEWGNGYAQAAVRQMLEFSRGYAEKTGVIAEIADTNIGSQRLFAKSGFIRQPNMFQDSDKLAGVDGIVRDVPFSPWLYRWA